MIEKDTIRLLRECDAGVKMGVNAICEVLPRVKNEDFKARLEKSRREHDKLSNKIEHELHRFEDEGKEPSAMAKSMSTLMTNMKLFMHEEDKTIASLITDGCNMGVKSLNQYLNEYEAAEEYAKDICKRLIHLEQELTREIRDFL